MAVDESLARRVRVELKGQPGLVEKKMFGGLAFLLNGNMSVGVFGSDLIVRLPQNAAEKALFEPGARLFDITGKPMKGWLLVDARGTGDRAKLASWIRRSVDFAASLPAKTAGA